MYVLRQPSRQRKQFQSEIESKVFCLWVGKTKMRQWWQCQPMREVPSCQSWMMWREASLWQECLKQSDRNALNLGSVVSRRMEEEQICWIDLNPSKQKRVRQQGFWVRISRMQKRTCLYSWIGLRWKHRIWEKWLFQQFLQKSSSTFKSFRSWELRWRGSCH